MATEPVEPPSTLIVESNLNSPVFGFIEKGDNVLIFKVPVVPVPPTKVG